MRLFVVSVLALVLLRAAGVPAGARSVFFQVLEKYFRGQRDVRTLELLQRPLHYGGRGSGPR